MTKLKLGIVTVVIAGMATLLAVQHQAQVKLHEEYGSLRERVDQLSGLAAENNRLSNMVAHANSSLANDQLKELLRLRSEVGLLRRQTNELARLREENRRLRGTLAAGEDFQATNSPPATAPENIFPKESWAFAGYATPEAALQSFTWAMSTGDVRTFQASMSPDGQLQLAGKYEGKSDTEIAASMVSDMDKTGGYRILGKDVVSENEVTLNIYIDGEDTQAKIKMQKIGNDWKFAGAAEN
jgi:hypothetical protein